MARTDTRSLRIGKINYDIATEAAAKAGLSTSEYVNRLITRVGPVGQVPEAPKVQQVASPAGVRAGMQFVFYDPIEGLPDTYLGTVWETTGLAVSRYDDKETPRPGLWVIRDVNQPQNKTRELPAFFLAKAKRLK